MEKLRRYVIEASKQCGRSILMEVGNEIDWGTYCQGNDLPGVRYVAHPAGLAQPKIAGLVEDRAKLRLPAAPAGQPAWPSDLKVDSRRRR